MHLVALSPVALNCAVAGHLMALLCRPLKRAFYGLHQHHPAVRPAAHILSIVNWHEQAFLHYQAHALAMSKAFYMMNRLGFLF